MVKPQHEWKVGLCAPCTLRAGTKVHFSWPPPLLGWRAAEVRTPPLEVAERQLGYRKRVALPCRVGRRREVKVDGRGPVKGVALVERVFRPPMQKLFLRPTPALPRPPRRH